jgi:hypothetical protein
MRSELMGKNQMNLLMVTGEDVSDMFHASNPFQRRSFVEQVG